MPPKRRPAEDSSSTSDDSSSKPKRVRKPLNKGSEDYKHRRDKNNVAVKKSRQQSRQKAKETIDRVNRLRLENEKLSQQVKLLSKELSVLKDLFKMAHTEGAEFCTASAQTEVSENGVLDFNLKSEDSEITRNDNDYHPRNVNEEALKKDHEYSASSKL